jgi:hypothetical protein
MEHAMAIPRRQVQLTVQEFAAVADQGNLTLNLFAAHVGFLMLSMGCAARLQPAAPPRKKPDSGSLVRLGELPE